MKKRIELNEARKLIIDNLQDFSTERVSLMDGLGRVCAGDIKAPMHQPPFDRSPLDGFALRAEDTAKAEEGHPVELKIVDWIYAGDRPEAQIEEGEAARIMTGAPIPPGADCVIRQENTEWDEDRVRLQKNLKPGQNYAPAGEDIEEGDLLVKDGTLLRSPHMGVLASMGMETVDVYPCPEASVITTGNELKPLGSELEEGKIYNSNNYMISSRLEETGAKVLDNIVVTDDRDRIMKAVDEEITHCDFLLTTGGVSVGEKDLMLEVFEELGAEILFWKLNLKPGTPIACARYRDTIIFGLSGNPAAALITYDLLVRHILVRINRMNHLGLQRTKAIFADEFPRSSGTRRFLRAWLVRSPDKNIVRLSRGKQRPGVLKSTLESNCYIDIPAGSPPLQEGEEVEVFSLPDQYHY